MISRSKNRPMQKLTIASFSFETINDAIYKAMEYETGPVLISSEIWLPSVAAGMMSTGCK